MLHFTIRAGEYFNIGDDIRVVILGGCANNCRVMVDAPREYNIVRGKVLERNAATPEEQERLGHYYPEPKLPPDAVRRMIAKQHRKAGEAGTPEKSRVGTGESIKPEEIGRKTAGKTGMKNSSRRTPVRAGTETLAREIKENTGTENLHRRQEARAGTETAGREIKENTGTENLRRRQEEKESTETAAREIKENTGTENLHRRQKAKAGTGAAAQKTAQKTESTNPC